MQVEESAEDFYAIEEIFLVFQSMNILLLSCLLICRFIGVLKTTLLKLILTQLHLVLLGLFNTNPAVCLSCLLLAVYFVGFCLCGRGGVIVMGNV